MPRLVSLKASPQEQTLPKGQTVRLTATAVFSDDSQKDVTDSAVFTSSDAKVAVGEKGGEIKAVGFGESVIVVSTRRHSDVVRLIVPRPLAKPLPQVETNNKIDELVLARLQKLGVPPSELCSDEVFLRRVWLDTTGVLPAVDVVRGFLFSKDAKSRPS
ncbi:MAG: DUF1549 domain-containing protein, partial [Candidatus Aminicenantales bacterium]